MTWKSHGEWRILDTFPNTSPLSHPCMNHVPFLRTFHYSSPTGSNEICWIIGRFFFFLVPVYLAFKKKKLFIRERERKRTSGGGAERKAGSPLNREPNVGLGILI